MSTPTPNAVRGHVHRIHDILEREGDAGVRDLVSSSWRRCLRDYQLDPSAPAFPTILTDHELAERRTCAEDIIECAKHEMTTLFQQLGDPELAVVLVDTGGVILHMVAAPNFSEEVGREGFRVGAVWSEGEIGTNGMGTCLVLGEPVVVRQHEHFFAKFTGLTCSAVPIFDPDGRIVAVLDVTSRSTLMQQHSLVLLGMTAQMIENRLIDRRHREDYPVHFHSRPELVYTLHEGMLVVSEDGHIRAANRSALFQLGFDSVESVRAKRLDEVFQVSLDDIVSRSVRSSFHPVPAFSAGSSSRFFMVAQEPASRASQERPRALIDAEAPSRPAVPAGHFSDARLTTQLALAGKVVARGIPVLLHGETGAGKEIFARALHQASPCSDGPFVAVNCASLPEGLIESELFGYRAGAFTGAQRSGRRGKILQADRGTLFLDEIGDMPLSLQARLLRVLDERMITPLGSEDPVPVEFQLVSASHRHLPERVAEGLFREDLYFRLCGLEVALPPLRERTDRRELIGRMLDEEAGRSMAMSRAVETLLMDYPWPGNLRQLRHVLRTAAVLCDGDCLEMAHLPPAVRPAQSVVLGDGEPSHPAEPVRELNPIEANERQVLLQLLDEHHWNVSQVAKALGVSRNTLYRKFHRLGIELKPPQ
ncbi:sigma-54-dependent Fis family transcriptional regulator [Nitrogeniibacter mangrovi]|uniref:Sigma-54-dependent Fis family transcriptional regulator n=1 Tax=Nitrogeniibacter mangrovi TaxID=2016596 RepID=A0A6C1B2R6_9RHOO|nr:sigma-54-dependent Fis family transcriptional regulator [Nitrogeniibacter mangrovi]QID16640.1 sigma-54-dependent Fis family transcriptional regulator [Nitrogeniibacter mangrovi]